VDDLTHEWNKVTGDSIPFAQTMLMVNNDFALNNPEMVKNFLQEFSENINWINTFPGLAARLIVAHKILPDSAAAAICIPRCNIKYVFAADAEKKIMSFFDILFQLNKDVLGGKLPDENFFYKE